MGSPHRGGDTGQCHTLIQVRQPRAEEWMQTPGTLNTEWVFCGDVSALESQSSFLGVTVIDGPEREQLGFFPIFFTGHLFVFITDLPLIFPK